MRCNGRDNTKKLCGFISIVVPLKNFFWGSSTVVTDANQQKHISNLKLKFERKSYQYDNNYYYFSDNKDNK